MEYPRVGLEYPREGGWSTIERGREWGCGIIKRVRVG